MAIDLQDLARRLFKAAETMWTNTGLRPDQYAQPVLALIALRQMEAKFLLVDAALKPTFTSRMKPTPAAYQAAGAMFVPEAARFSRLLALPGNANLGAELTTAMDAITEANPELVGVMPRGYVGSAEYGAGRTAAPARHARRGGRPLQPDLRVFQGRVRLRVRLESPSQQS